MDEPDAPSSNAGFRCGECGALLVLRAREGSGAVEAACSSCRSVYDLEGLVCAPAEIDALDDEVALGIRRAFE